MNSRDLFNILLSGDLNPTLRAELPGALTSARRGDTAPLIRLAARSAGIIELGSQAAGEEFSDTVFAATLCEEGTFPWERSAGAQVRSQQARALVRSLGDGPFYPFLAASALDTDIIELCLGWPAITAPPAPPGPLPNVPTLVIDGTADVRTPLEDAAKLAAQIPAAQVLAIPYTGHSALGGDQTPEKCGQRGVAQFFAGVPVAPCAVGGNPFSPTPVAPTRISASPEPAQRAGSGARSRPRSGRPTTSAAR